MAALKEPTAEVVPERPKRSKRQRRQRDRPFGFPRKEGYSLEQPDFPLKDGYSLEQRDFPLKDGYSLEQREEQAIEMLEGVEAMLSTIEEAMVQNIAALKEPTAAMGVPKRPKRCKRLRRQRDRPIGFPLKDGYNLEEREEQAIKMLEGVDISVELLTLGEALSLHLISKDKKFRRALRAVTALKHVKGPTMEDVDDQLEIFYEDISDCVSKQELNDKEANDLRSIFLMAGHLREKKYSDMKSECDDLKTGL